MKKHKNRTTHLYALAMTVLLLVSMLALPASAQSYYVTKPASGKYYICPAASTNYALDVKGGNLNAQTYIWLYTRSENNKAQIVEIRHEGEGDWFTIRLPEKFLSVQGSLEKSGSWPLVLITIPIYNSRKRRYH